MAAHRIRLAGLADVPALVALMAAFYAESDYPLPADRARDAFAALLADARLGGVWIAGGDDDPDGYAVLTVGYSMEYGGLRGFVDDLFVRPGARGAGVASALLRAARDECVARGVRAIHVEVGPENGVALRIYTRAGFAESGHLLLTLPLADPVHVAG